MPDLVGDLTPVRTLHRTHTRFHVGRDHAAVYRRRTPSDLTAVDNDYWLPATGETESGR
jgi:hypothetical protein